MRREHCEVLTRVLLQYRLLLRFSCSWSKLEAEICRIAVRNIVSAGRMLDARKRGLGGRGGRRQAVSAAFIAFSNRGPPKSDGYAHYPLAQWRNGQWADPMLAHAGTEAVRLVPFSSLLLSAESLSDYRSSAWRLPLCRDAVRIKRLERRLRACGGLGGGGLKRGRCT